MTRDEKVFWLIRRVLGFRDLDNAPEVDRVIRRELEMYPPASVSIARIKRQIGLYDA